MDYTHYVIEFDKTVSVRFWHITNDNVGENVRVVIMSIGVSNYLSNRTREIDAHCHIYTASRTPSVLLSGTGWGQNV